MDKINKIKNNVEYNLDIELIDKIINFSSDYLFHEENKFLLTEKESEKSFDEQLQKIHQKLDRLLFKDFKTNAKYARDIYLDNNYINKILKKCLEDENYRKNIMSDRLLKNLLDSKSILNLENETLFQKLNDNLIQNFDYRNHPEPKTTSTIIEKQIHGFYLNYGLNEDLKIGLEKEIGKLTEAIISNLGSDLEKNQDLINKLSVILTLNKDVYEKVFEKTIDSFFKVINEDNREEILFPIVSKLYYNSFNDKKVNKNERFVHEFNISFKKSFEKQNLFDKELGMSIKYFEFLNKENLSYYLKNSHSINNIIFGTKSYVSSSQEEDILNVLLRNKNIIYLENDDLSIFDIKLSYQGYGIREYPFSEDINLNDINDLNDLIKFFEKSKLIAHKMHGELRDYNRAVLLYKKLNHENIINSENTELYDTFFKLFKMDKLSYFSYFLEQNKITSENKKIEDILNQFSTFLGENNINEFIINNAESLYKNGSIQNSTLHEIKNKIESSKYKSYRDESFLKFYNSTFNLNIDKITLSEFISEKYYRLGEDNERDIKILNSLNFTLDDVKKEMDGRYNTSNIKEGLEFIIKNKDKIEDFENKFSFLNDINLHLKIHDFNILSLGNRTDSFDFSLIDEDTIAQIFNRSSTHDFSLSYGDKDLIKNRLDILNEILSINEDKIYTLIKKEGRHFKTFHFVLSSLSSMGTVYGSNNFDLIDSNKELLLNGEKALNKINKILSKILFESEDSFLEYGSDNDYDIKKFLSSEEYLKFVEEMIKNNYINYSNVYYDKNKKVNKFLELYSSSLHKRLSPELFKDIASSIIINKNVASYLEFRSHIGLFDKESDYSDFWKKIDSNKIPILDIFFYQDILFMNNVDINKSFLTEQKVLDILENDFSYFVFNKILDENKYLLSDFYKLIINNEKALSKILKNNMLMIDFFGNKFSRFIENNYGIDKKLDNKIDLISNKIFTDFYLSLENKSKSKKIDIDNILSEYLMIIYDDKNNIFNNNHKNSEVIKNIITHKEYINEFLFNNLKISSFNFENKFDMILNHILNKSDDEKIKFVNYVFDNLEKLQGNLSIAEFTRIIKDKAPFYNIELIHDKLILKFSKELGIPVQEIKDTYNTKKKFYDEFLYLCDFFLLKQDYYFKDKHKFIDLLKNKYINKTSNIKYFIPDEGIKFNKDIYNNYNKIDKFIVKKSLNNDEHINISNSYFEQLTQIIDPKISSLEVNEKLMGIEINSIKGGNDSIFKIYRNTVFKSTSKINKILKKYNYDIKLEGGKNTIYKKNFKGDINSFYQLRSDLKNFIKDFEDLKKELSDSIKSEELKTKINNINNDFDTDKMNDFIEKYFVEEISFIIEHLDMQKSLVNTNIIDEMSGDFQIEYGDRNNLLELFSLGENTDCCVSLDSGSKMYDYIIRENINHIHIRDNKTNKIIANAFILLGKDYEDNNYIVVDNIEMNGNYNSFESEFRDKLLNYIHTLKKEAGFDGILQGSSLNDIKLYELDGKNPTSYAQSIGNVDCYLDSGIRESSSSKILYVIQDKQK